jgi:hypothetical protein
MQQDVAVPGISQPGASDILCGFPKSFPGSAIDGENAVVGRRRLAAAGQLAFRAAWEFVEQVDPAAAGDDAIVQKAVFGFDSPELLAE